MARGRLHAPSAKSLAIQVQNLWIMSMQVTQQSLSTFAQNLPVEDFSGPNPLAQNMSQSTKITSKEIKLSCLYTFSGKAAALFLFFSPVIILRRILQKKSSEEFCGVPYTMTLLNSLLSAWYRLPYNILVCTINSTAATIETTCAVVSLVFASEKGRKNMLILIYLIVFVSKIVQLLAMTVLHGQVMKFSCRFDAKICCSSSLTIMIFVRKTIFVEFLPIFTFLYEMSCGLLVMAVPDSRQWNLHAAHVKDDTKSP